MARRVASSPRSFGRTFRPGREVVAAPEQGDREEVRDLPEEDDGEEAGARPRRSSPSPAVQPRSGGMAPGIAPTRSACTDRRFIGVYTST